MSFDKKAAELDKVLDVLRRFGNGDVIDSTAFEQAVKALGFGEHAAPVNSAPAVSPLSEEEVQLLRANRNSEAHKSLLYLAGPITGCTYGACVDWRVDFAAKLPDFILPISPMRAKNYLKDRGILEGSYNEFALSTERGINKRDKTDVRRADMVFVNFLGASRVSIGTVMEIAWAQEYQKPIVVAMEKSGNPHDGHPMLNDSIDFRVDNLDDAMYIVTHILRTGV